MSDDSFQITRTNGTHCAALHALMRLMTALPAIGPCSVSTISQSKPADAMISADSGLSKASHEPTLTAPAFNLFLTLFSRISQSLRFLGPFLVVACISVAAAAPLSPTLAPPPPFPQITAQSEETESVAPGVMRTDYRLATKAGPLVVEIVAVDLHQPTVRLGSVVATDHLISEGETLSSMAQRTHAIAGINADYFDIGQTNQ